MAKIYGNTIATPIPIPVVDQNYDAKSEKAQSGKAVAEAIVSKADKTVVDKLSSTFEKNLIECTSSGTAINIKDSAEVKPRGLKLYGKTTQGENPSPENPQELISIGDSGKLDVELYGKNLWDKEYASDKNNWTFLNPSYSSVAIYVGKDNYVTFSYKDKLQTGLGIHVAIMTENITADTVSTWLYHSTVPYMINNVVTIKATEDYVYLRAQTAPNSLFQTFWEYIGNDLQIEISPSATDYESYKKQSISILTPDGLLGIPVTSDGNYTDENGRQYICDEVDFEREVHIKRVNKYEITGEEKWKKGFSDGGFAVYECEVAEPDPAWTNSLWSYFPFDNNIETTRYGATVGSLGTNRLVLKIVTQHSTADECKAFLAEQFASGNPVTVCYIIKTPIETPLTEDEIVSYKELTMYKPVTNVFNSDNANMEVDYVADTKTYIDNKFTELQNAIISTGGNV